MTAVVGSAKSPHGELKNCDTWSEYEDPGSSEFSNLCNGGSYEGYRWQACPSRMRCRLNTHRQEREEGSQVLASTRSRFGSTTLPTRQDTFRQEAIRKAPAPSATVVYPDDDHTHLKTARLEGGTYRPSPTFLPDRGESLVSRILKNVFQAMFHAVFHQGKEMAENVDFFPYRRPPRDEDHPSETNP